MIACNSGWSQADDGRAAAPGRLGPADEVADPAAVHGPLLLAAQQLQLLPAPRQAGVHAARRQATAVGECWSLSTLKCCWSVL